MAMIEFTKNRYAHEEANEMQMTLEVNDMMTFWQWEKKVIEQEISYYEDHLRRQKAKTDKEVHGTQMVQAKQDIDFLKGPVRRNQPVRFKPRKVNKKGEALLTLEEITQQVEDKYAD